MATVSYPFDGELFPAREKKFRETVFFVHFFEGEKKAMARHVKLVRDIGFDAFTFNLAADFSIFRPPLSSTGKFGYKHVYADQIEALLNLIPGEKIVYAFSNPTSAAIEAMARRHCADVKALVADSGPSGKFVRSVYNLYSREKKVGNPLLLAAYTPMLSVAWSPRLHGDLQDDLETFPTEFPILSIRGWKDPLIPPDQIDAVFSPHANLDWRKLALPEAGHLNGLRDFRKEYVPQVTDFLKSVGTPIAPA